ncbi:uncharacterized protein LOC135805292 [Sycon ciliatum]|uniref:uncharacterized protein LOC135805292 n=1 Tax=Sycon ciliatum TaxID=27933 RepID=UPI0031F668C1
MVLDNRHVLIGLLLALLATEGSSQLGSSDKDNYVAGTVLPLGYGSGGPFQPDKDIVSDLDATHPPDAVITSSSATHPPEAVITSSSPTDPPEPVVTSSSATDPPDAVITSSSATDPPEPAVTSSSATDPPEAVVTSSSTTDPPEPVDSAKCNETFHFENGKYYVKTTREPFESPDTVAIFQCNLGFNLIGWQAILCDETPPAQWYKAPPTCQQYECLDPPYTKKGIIKRKEGGRYPGGTIIYSCKTGFWLDGPDILTCRNGTFDWFPSPPVCRPITCPIPPSIRNGAVTWTPGLRFGSKATWTCDQPYILAGSLSAVCAGGGEWITYRQPTCEPKCYDTVPRDFYERPPATSTSSPEPGCGPSAADIIVIVDESDSMVSVQKAWFHETIRYLEDSLRKHGIGVYPDIPNQYSLVGFGRSHFPNDRHPIAQPRVILDSSGNRVYGVDGFEEACAALQASGSREDGYNSIRFALEDIPELRLRQASVAPIVILVTDEDRDRHRDATSLTRSGLKQLIRKSGAQLECIVDNSFLMNGREGYGMDAGGVVYRSSRFVGQFEKVLVTGNPRRVTGYHRRNVRRDYTHVALELGGAAWDLKKLLLDDVPDYGSVQAFVNRTVEMVEHRVHKCCTCRCTAVDHLGREREPSSSTPAYLSCQAAATAADCIQGRMPNAFRTRT